MNSRKIIALIVLLLPGFALAEEIVLRDGSRIQGEVLSMQNGAYQVKTPSLGVINIPKSKVSSINSGGSSSSADSALSSANNSMLESLQSRMVNNPGIMTSIMQLQHDPDMKAVMSDPEVMRAVQNMDFKTLSNHPKIKKLMQNSKVRDISGSLK